MSRAVIFDMDGVIFDTIPLARDAFLKMHPGMTEEIYNELFMGNFHEEAHKYSYLRVEETEEEKLKRYAEYGEAKAQSQAFPGMKEIVEKLKKEGSILALNTNAYRINTLPLLERSGLRNHFDLIADAEMSKSKVEKFKLIEEKYGLRKEDIVFVTDTVGDVREAEAAGIPTIGVTWGAHSRAHFDKEKFSVLRAIVVSPQELEGVLGIR